MQSLSRSPQEDLYSAPGTVVATVQEKLRRSGSAVHVCVSDVSDGHTYAGYADGRALSKDGLELLVLVVDDGFEGMNTLERHRHVNNILWEEFQSNKIHSLQIKAQTVKQWEARGRPATFRPGTACSQYTLPEKGDRLRSEL